MGGRDFPASSVSHSYDAFIKSQDFRGLAALPVDQPPVHCIFLLIIPLSVSPEDWMNPAQGNLKDPEIK